MTRLWSEYRTRASEWFAQRSPREQALLAGLAAVALMVVLIGGVWRPLAASRVEARTQIRTYEVLSARLRAAGPALAARTPRRVGSPATIITDTAAESGLTIQRLEPQGALTRVSLEDADFERLVRWIDRLESDGGLRLSEVKLDRRPAPGVVNAQLLLTGG